MSSVGTDERHTTQAGDAGAFSPAAICSAESLSFGSAAHAGTLLMYALSVASWGLVSAMCISRYQAGAE